MSTPLTSEAGWAAKRLQGSKATEPSTRFTVNGCWSYGARTETPPSLVAAKTGFGSTGGRPLGTDDSTIHDVAGGGAEERQPVHATMERTRPAARTKDAIFLESGVFRGSTRDGMYMLSPYMIPSPFYLPTARRAASLSGSPAARIRSCAAATSYSSRRKRTVREPASYMTYDARGSPSRG